MWLARSFFREPRKPTQMAEQANGTSRTRVRHFARRGTRLTLPLAALCLAAGVMAQPTPIGADPAWYSGEPAWYHASWSYRKKITIDRSKVPSTLTDFPVLVSFTTDTDLAADAQDDADDLLITAGDGTTKLAHEIEKFNGSTGELVAWVKVPVLSSTESTVLYLYYGNAGAASQQNATGVWDSNYKGVWHLKEDPSTTCSGTKEFCDSTSNANHGDQNNMEAGDQVAAKINGGVDLDGSNEYADMGNPSTLDDLAAISASAWIKADTQGASYAAQFIAKSTTISPVANGWGFGWEFRNGNTQQLRFEVSYGIGATNLAVLEP